LNVERVGRLFTIEVAANITKYNHCLPDRTVASLLSQRLPLVGYWL
jgi:hypothetical protein